METWRRGASAVRFTTARSFGRVRVTAGGPSGPRPGRPAAARAFEASSRRAGARVLWFAVEDPSDIGHDRPAVVIGAEPVWGPGRWEHVVATQSSVRSQIARARNKGVGMTRWDPGRVRRSHDLRAVLDAWLSTRGLPPLGFMADPFVLADPGDREVWVAGRDGQVEGYLGLVPGPEALVEWIIQRPRAPNGTAALLIDAAVRSLPAGVGFTLGMVPLSTHAPLSTPAPARPVRGLLAWTRAHATRFYNFEGLERFKAKFRPDRWRPLHLVTEGGPVTALTFHAVAAAFAGGSPTAFVARGLARAVADEARAVRRRALSSP